VCAVRNHQCLPNIAKNEVEVAMNKTKKRSREELTPVTKIFAKELEPLLEAGLEFVSELPTFQNKKSSLYRARHNALGVMKFTSCEDVVLPEQLSKDFLLFEDGEKEKILCSSTISSRQTMTECSEFFCDGTFKSCCRQFAQLYTIHGDIGSTSKSTNIIPLMYVLLPNKLESTYVRLFELIKKYIPLWKPEKIKIDYEMAAIQAIRKILPEVTLKGCNFHFNQCLWRKVQDIGLSQMYKENEEIRNHVRMCAALSHLPPEHTDDGWINIMENCPSEHLIQEFNDYFVDQWLENNKIRDMWICFKERHRTTNSLEGWHHRLNQKISKIHPNVFEIITILRSEALYFDNIKQQIDLYMTPKKRMKRYAYLDERIESTVNDYLNQKINVGRCLKNLSYIVKMQF